MKMKKILHRLFAYFIRRDVPDDLSSDVRLVTIIHQGSESYRLGEF